MTTSQYALRLFAGENAMRRAMTWAVIFAALWAFLEVSLGAALRTPFNLMQIVWCRYAIHLCICLLLWGSHRPTALWKTSLPASHIFRSALMIIMPTAFALAVYRGIAPEFVWAVFWISPALIIGLGSLFLKENPPLAAVIASIIGCIAAAATVGHLRPPSATALALALAVAGSFSIYVVMTRSLRDEAVEANMFYTAVCPVVVLTPFLPSIWIGPNMQDAIVLMAIGIIGFLALFALDNACRAAPVWSSANAIFAQALFVAVLVSGFPDVHLNSYALFGMAALIATIGFLWARADRLIMPINSGSSRA